MLQWGRMSRPIPVEIIPSHVHLSEADHLKLFGPGHAGTIASSLSQYGQYAYEETVEVAGKLKRTLRLRVLGPYRKQSQVELTPTEAQLLGLQPPVARSGDLSEAVSCKLKGPAGELTLKAAVIVPKPHLHLSDADARSLRLDHATEVSMDILGDHPRTLDNVIVRVHPTYRLRLHVHPDLARDVWLTGVLHARIREAHV